MSRHTTGVAAAVLAALSVICAGCGGGSDSPKTPTAPSGPTVSSLAISPGTDLLLIGKSETFVANATFSDGSSRQVSATWSSADSSVVSIDGAGLATGRGAGSTTITASAEGRTATRVIRGLPDFGGYWLVEWRELACDVPGRWGAGFCNVSGVNTMEINLARAEGDRLVGTMNNGIGWTGTVSGQVAVDGTLKLTGRLVSDRSWVTFYSDLSEWQTRLSSVDGMTGTFTEILTWVGEAEQGFARNEIVRGTRYQASQASRNRGGSPLGGTRSSSMGEGRAR